MATVVIDPLGSPEPLFLRSGIAVLDIAAGHADPNGPPVVPEPIPLVSDHLIVRVTATPNEVNAVELPANAPVGVLAEIYSAGESVQVYSASGDNINGLSGYGGNASGWFRKVTATGWRALGVI